MSGQSPDIDDDERVSPESVIEFLEFRLHGDRYALELGRVGQVVRKPATTRVPNAPSGIYGSTTVEGDVVVVADTYAVVGTDRPFTAPEDAYLVVLDEDETPQLVGFLVEAVDGIERRHVESVSPPTEGGAPLDDRWFRAVVADGGGSDIHVFDSHQLVAALHPVDAR